MKATIVSLLCIVMIIFRTMPWLSERTLLDKLYCPLFVKINNVTENKKLSYRRLSTVQHSRSSKLRIDEKYIYIVSHSKPSHTYLSPVMAFKSQLHHIFLPLDVFQIMPYTDV